MVGLKLALIALALGLVLSTSAASAATITGLDDAVSPVVADFNGDGHLDFAVSTFDGTDVFLGDGAGGFKLAPGSPLPVGAGNARFTVADFNGDGHPDLVGMTSPISRRRARRSGWRSATGVATFMELPARRTPPLWEA